MEAESLSHLEQRNYARPPVRSQLKNGFIIALHLANKLFSPS